MKTIRIGIAIIVTMFLSASAFANGSWIVGVAAQYGDGPYYSKQSRVAPLIMYERNRLTLSTLDGASLRISEFSDEKPYTGSVSLIASPRTAPSFGGNSIYDNIDRKHGLDVGITGDLTYGVVALEFRGLSDITNSHNGYEFSSKISYQPAALPLEYGFGIRYRDRNLNQYLFGVTPSESTEQRSAFMADGQVTGFISGMVALPLSQNLMSYLQIEYEDLGGLADSPLVSEASVSQFTLGVIYQR